MITFTRSESCEQLHSYSCHNFFNSRDTELKEHHERLLIIFQPAPAGTDVPEGDTEQGKHLFMELKAIVGDISAAFGGKPDYNRRVPDSISIDFNRISRVSDSIEKSELANQGNAPPSAIAVQDLRVEFEDNKPKAAASVAHVAPLAQMVEQTPVLTQATAVEVEAPVVTQVTPAAMSVGTVGEETPLTQPVVVGAVGEAPRSFADLQNTSPGGLATQGAPEATTPGGIVAVPVVERKPQEEKQYSRLIEQMDNLGITPKLVLTLKSGEGDKLRTLIGEALSLEPGKSVTLTELKSPCAEGEEGDCAQLKDKSASFWRLYQRFYLATKLFGAENKEVWGLVKSLSTSQFLNDDPIPLSPKERISLTLLHQKAGVIEELPLEIFLSDIDVDIYSAVAGDVVPPPPEAQPKNPPLIAVPGVVLPKPPPGVLTVFLAGLAPVATKRSWVLFVDKNSSIAQRGKKNSAIEGRHEHMRGVETILSCMQYPTFIVIRHPPVLHIILIP